jgi:hypothetical protein
MNVSDLLSSLGLTGNTQEPQFFRRQEEYSPAVENIYERVQQMSQEEKSNLLGNLLKRLQLNATYQQFADQYVDGSGFAGRIGYTQPLDRESDLSFGVSGSGYKVDTPVGRLQDYGVTGGDIGYRFGPNRISASYDRSGSIGNELGQVPVQDLVRLLYQRQF